MNTFKARLSDGRTAASVDAVVEIGQSGLIVTPAGGAAEIWPFRVLAPQTPITRHSADALLIHSDRPGATLFVGDPAFAPALLAQSGNLGAGQERWRILRPMLAATVLVAIAVGAVFVFGLNPSRAIAGLLPDRARDSIGEHVIAGLTEQRRICETPQSRAALDRLVARLIGNSNPKLAPRVAIVDWSLVNAFAVPGRRVVLMRGLIDKAQNSDEVAGVLAHEIGHTLELHPETALVRGVGMMAAVQLIFTGQPGTLANAGVVLAQLSYSRVAETEADEQAIRLLKAAGISSQGMVQFFERLEGLGKPAAKKDAPDTKGDKEAKDSKDATGVKEVKPVEPPSRIGAATSEILRSHPMTGARIEHIRRAGVYAATPALSPEDWLALRTACGPLPVVVAPKPPASKPSVRQPPPAPTRPGEIRT